jgi:hypothetical protein
MGVIKSRGVTTIFVARDGEQLGEFSLGAIQDGLAIGRFLPGDMAWHEGLPDWLPLSEVVVKLWAAAPSKEASATPEAEVGAYLIKDAKHKLGDVKEPEGASWRSEPAQAKQVVILRALGVEKLPETLTRGQAHSRIDTLLANGVSFNLLTPQDIAALDYHGFDPVTINPVEAGATLKKIQETPWAFKVSEPWEYAKSRLYPKLYPAQAKKKSAGCAIALAVTAVFLLGALLWAMRFIVSMAS